MDGRNAVSEEIARTDDAPALPRGSVFDEIVPQSNPRARCIVAGIALALALISFFLIAPWAGSPQTYAGIIASLDEKRSTVMQLVAGSTGTSAAITLLPGDVGTPIAQKLLDLGSDFAIVIGAIYLEKYMLTILGLAAFRVLVPAGFAAFAIAALLSGRAGLRSMLYQLSVRLVFFGIAIFLVVPASVMVSSVIEDTYESTVASTLESLEQDDGIEAGEPEGEPRQGIDAVVDFFQGIPESISNAASGVSEEVQTRLNLFIETLAVMIVTSCVIPILVLMFFLWLARVLLGVRIDVPVGALAPRSMRSLRR